MNHVYFLLEAVKEAEKAKESGNNPFGAILVDNDGKILLRQGNIEITEKDCTGHAEAALMRAASKKYSKDFLWHCSLYTSIEPCCMCSGAIYWGNVGTLIYAMPEAKLLELTGSDPQNPTFNLPSREIFKHGQKDIKVIGPFAELYKEISKAHLGFWQK